MDTFAAARRQLRLRWAVAPRDGYVCENPNLVAIAADALGPHCAPLVCTDGMPAASQRAVLSQMVCAGARLRYHGDFDWPGIAIGNAVVETSAPYLGVSAQTITAPRWRTMRIRRARSREQWWPLAWTARWRRRCRPMAGRSTKKRWRTSCCRIWTGVRSRLALGRPAWRRSPAPDRSRMRKFTSPNRLALAFGAG